MAKSNNASERTPEPNSKQPQPEKREVRGDIGITGELKTIFPPAFLDEYKASSHRENVRENERLGLEKGTFIFVVVVALLSLIQTCQSMKSLKLASQSLQIGERAYISIGTPHFAWEENGIKLPLLNTGHIPSGYLHSEVHEATYVGSPKDSVKSMRPIEGHWGKSEFKNVDPTPGSALFALFVRIDSSSEAALNAGTQRIIYAGKVSYNDGFPDSPERSFNFCAVSFYLASERAQSMKPCDASIYIPFLMKQEHYPANEQKDAEP